MTDLLKKSALLALVTGAACVSNGGDAGRPTPALPPASSGVVHVNPHFNITLPLGWTAAESRSEPTENLGLLSDGVVALRAVGPEGYYLDVWFECPGTELAGDSWWQLAADGTGRSVDRIDEKNAKCTPESARECVKRYEAPGALGPGPEYCSCSVGDGRLEIWARFDGKHPYASSNGVCFRLGNSLHEGADRALLRGILKTFHLEGPVDAPRPRLSPPGASQKSRDESVRSPGGSQLPGR
jgi:hypothetical protein